MAHQYNPSDLTSVLNTLSTLTNPISIPPNANHNDTHHDPSPDHNHDDYDPYEPPEPIHPQPPAPAAPTPKHLDNTPKPRPRSDDPSTITTWPPALRHVMHTMSQNEALQRKIRRLLHNQHSHERNWWDGREALVRKQVARAEKKRELDAVLYVPPLPLPLPLCYRNDGC